MSAAQPPQLPEVHLWLTLDRVYATLSRNLHNKLDAFGLTTPQYRVLRRLHGSPQSAAQLAEGLGVTAGNLTGVLDRLESAGLMTRERDPGDRRSLRLHLSPAGQALVDRAAPQVRAHVRSLFAPLASAEVEDLTDMLERLDTHLNAPAAVGA